MKTKKPGRENFTLHTILLPFQFVAFTKMKILSFLSAFFIFLFCMSSAYCDQLDRWIEKVEAPSKELDLILSVDEWDKTYTYSFNDINKIRMKRAIKAEARVREFRRSLFSDMNSRPYQNLISQYLSNYQQIVHQMRLILALPMNSLNGSIPHIWFHQTILKKNLEFMRLYDTILEESLKGKYSSQPGRCLNPKDSN